MWLTQIRKPWLAYVLFSENPCQWDAEQVDVAQEVANEFVILLIETVCARDYCVDHEAARQLTSS